MKVYQINLSLSAEKMTKFYAGDAKLVWARDVHGLSVSFPLEVLRPFVSRDGVRGLFRLTVAANNKLQRIEKLA